MTNTIDLLNGFNLLYDLNELINTLFPKVGFASQSVGSSRKNKVSPKNKSAKSKGAKGNSKGK